MPEQTTAVPDEPFATHLADDPYPAYAALRAEGGAREVTLPSGARAWLVTRYDQARQALADPRLSKDPERAEPAWRAVALLSSGPGGFPFARHMLNTDPPDHTRLRRLVNGAFTARRVEGLRDRVQRITDDLLDRVDPAGPTDLITSFAFPLPITVICELLGVPTDDRDDFRSWSTTLVSPPHGDERDGAMVEAGGRMYEYLTRLIAQRETDPGDDLLGALVAARDEGNRLDGEELVSMVFLLLVAGHETTVNLIGNGVFALVRHPDQLAAVLRDPGLLPGAVEEILRYEGPVRTATFRFATEPVEIGGVVVPAGAPVLISLGAAGRDPDRFPDPDRLDVTRGDNQHLAFGHGIHHCLGAPLARMEGRIALGTLLRRFPRLRLAVPAEELRWRDGVLMRGLHALPTVLEPA